MLVFSFSESLVCCHCQRKERVSRAPWLPRTTKAVVGLVTPAWYSWTGGAVFMAAPQHGKKIVPWSLTSNNHSTPTLLLALQASDKNVSVVRCWLWHRTPYWVLASPLWKSWASCFCVPQFPWRQILLYQKVGAGDQLHLSQQHFWQNGTADWLWHYPKR